MDPEKEFNSLISYEEIVRLLIKGSCSSGSYEEWKAKRAFVADVIDSSGTILDIGCANGFFLRCLQEWSGHELTPYGIDVQIKLIRQARFLFSVYEDHFIHLDVRNIQDIENFPTIPSSFDYISWNFALDWNIANASWRNIYERILAIARKRLIILFYGRNSHISGTQPPFASDDWLTDKRSIEKVVESFENAGIIFTGKKWNPTGWNQMMTWIDNIQLAVEEKL